MNERWRQDILKSALCIVAKRYILSFSKPSGIYVLPKMDYPLSGDTVTLIKQKLSHIPTSYAHLFPLTTQRWKSKLFPAGPCALWPPGNPSALMTSSYQDPFTAWNRIHWLFLSFGNLLHSSLPQGLCTYCFFHLLVLFLSTLCISDSGSVNQVLVSCHLLVDASLGHLTCDKRLLSHPLI